MTNIVTIFQAPIVVAYHFHQKMLAKDIFTQAQPFMARLIFHDKRITGMAL
jgi:hypothetical protein